MKAIALIDPVNGGLSVNGIFRQSWFGIDLQLNRIMGQISFRGRAAPVA